MNLQHLTYCMADSMLVAGVNGHNRDLDGTRPVAGNRSMTGPKWTDTGRSSSHWNIKIDIRTIALIWVGYGY